MKGIILAGGTGSRLYPTTVVTSKHLLPVYNKPMIYYPISTLMLAGIDDILLIASREHEHLYKMLLGDGSRWGIRITYEIQEAPTVLPEAFIIGRDFIGDETCCLILADNFFYGQGLGPLVANAAKRNEGATIFAYWVKDPQRYGVLDMDRQGKVRTLLEKPENPPTNWAVTGLYIYDPGVSEHAMTLEPSGRGETEITDLNNIYLSEETLRVELMSRGFAWMDMGTHDSLLKASNFVQMIEEEQGLMIACLEEIAFSGKLIGRQQVLDIADGLKGSSYADYLRRTVSLMDGA